MGSATYLRGVAIASACALFLLVWAWFRLGQAEDAQASRRSQIQQLTADVARLHALSQSLGGTAEPIQPAVLLETVQDTLDTIRVPVSCCTGLQPRGRSGASTGIQIQELSLSGLSPVDLGRWCAAWSQRQTGWRIVGMTWRTGLAGGTPGGLDAGPSQVTLSLASVQPE